MVTLLCKPFGKLLLLCAVVEVMETGVQCTRWTQLGGVPAAAAGCRNCPAASTEGWCWRMRPLLLLLLSDHVLGLFLGLFWEASALGEIKILGFEAGKWAFSLWWASPGRWLPSPESPSPSQMRGLFDGAEISSLGCGLQPTEQNGFETVEGEELKALPRGFFFFYFSSKVKRTLNLYEVYVSASNRSLCWAVWNFLCLLVCSLLRPDTHTW